MSNRTIEVVISPQGDTTITTQGFAGAECQQASEYLEKALGQQSTETLTAEFHTQQSTEVSQLRQN